MTAAAIVLGCICGALVREAGPMRVPLARLEKNLGTYIAEHPKDAQGHYVLGRVRTFAFVAETTAVDSWAGDPEHDLPRVRGLYKQIVGKYEYRRLESDGIPLSALTPDAREMTRLLEGAAEELRRAIALDPTDATSHLTLAFLLERSRHLVGIADAVAVLALGDSKPTPELELQLYTALRDIADADAAKAEAGARVLETNLDAALPILDRHWVRANPRAAETTRRLLRQGWVRCCALEYKRAFDLASQGDLALADHRQHGELVSWDAGTSIARLRSEELGPFPLDDDMLKSIAAHVQAIDAIPAHYAISPIVLPDPSAKAIGDLVATNHRVCFDLDGDGRVEDCSWVRPTTGILAWDPDHTGKIESGRDLFGNATWWLLFADGYRALDALDDDRDGWLSGAELSGLAIWYDLDSNGHSDPGEVIPIENTDVLALATKFDAREGTALRATRGMLLRGGEVRPTYDWYADCKR